MLVDLLLVLLCSLWSPTSGESHKYSLCSACVYGVYYAHALKLNLWQISLKFVRSSYFTFDIGRTPATHRILENTQIYFAGENERVSLEREKKSQKNDRLNRERTTSSSVFLKPSRFLRNREIRWCGWQRKCARVWKKDRANAELTYLFAFEKYCHCKVNPQLLACLHQFFASYSYQPAVYPLFSTSQRFSRSRGSIKIFGSARPHHSYISWLSGEKRTNDCENE